MMIIIMIIMIMIIMIITIIMIIIMIIMITYPVIFFLSFSSGRASATCGLRA